MSEAMPTPKKRVIHWFKLPKSVLDQAGGVAKLGFVELTANEELFATKRCAGDVGRMVFELARESLRYADDKPISTSDESVDVLWSGFGPAVRNMALSAYNKLHSTKPEDMADFLDSRVVTTA